MNKVIIAYFNLYLAYSMLYLKGEPSIFFKIEVKFKIKYFLPKDFVCVD